MGNRDVRDPICETEQSSKMTLAKCTAATWHHQHLDKVVPAIYSDPEAQPWATTGTKNTLSQSSDRSAVLAETSTWVMSIFRLGSDTITGAV